VAVVPPDAEGSEYGLAVPILHPPPPKYTASYLPRNYESFHHAQMATIIAATTTIAMNQSKGIPNIPSIQGPLLPKHGTASYLPTITIKTTNPITPRTTQRGMPITVEENNSVNVIIPPGKMMPWGD
jgi:hypothetical protein